MSAKSGGHHPKLKANILPEQWGEAGVVLLFSIDNKKTVFPELCSALTLNGVGVPEVLPGIGAFSISQLHFDDD